MDQVSLFLYRPETELDDQCESSVNMYRTDLSSKTFISIHLRERFLMTFQTNILIMNQQY